MPKTRNGELTPKQRAFVEIFVKEIGLNPIQMLYIYHEFSKKAIVFEFVHRMKQRAYRVVD